MKKQHVHSIDYEAELNPSQAEAVTAPGGPILVIAGAGSGKTRTVVYRVAWLIEQGIDPASILLLTFTRKAAEEMLSRAAALLDSRASRVAGGTFHSIGNLLLRRYAPLLGYDSSFSIMDQADTHEVVDLARKNLSPQPLDLKRFPKTRTIAEVLSRSVGGGGTVAEILSVRYPHLAEHAADVERVRVLYEEHKKTNNLMDYDDLLVNTIRLLEEHEHVREEVSNRWQYVLVDEYQDTNRLQARIVRLLASTHDNVMVVGDDSQSIYSFRGADFTNIMEFPNLFAGAKIVKLEENYRSTDQILKVTNSIIRRASVGYPKKLFTRKEDGPKPMAARPMTERDQSRFVIQCVKELNGHGIPLRDIAVLFRAGFHSFDLEGELARNGIPYVKYGGMKFLESLHIKDVLAHLKVINNYKDRLSWSRILRLLPGIGAKTAMSLATQIATNGVPDDTSHLAPPGRKYAGDVRKLLSLIHGLRDNQGPIADKVAMINEYYAPFLKEKFDNYPKRMRDLEQLANLTVTYRSLNRFLNDMALEPPDDDGPRSESPHDSLVLSTIHSSKGLEWHTVILLWATEGRIPSPRAEDSVEDIEEERRLVYVATTRAMHNLVVLAPRTFFDRRIGQVSTNVSRFFEEVPRDFFRVPPGT
ncbi:MAG: ATP-dependent helicase [Desulfomonilaceae bacterium]|nr:ATP-dependent helicase [Desulfomonilaceae bacterium]